MIEIELDYENQKPFQHTKVFEANLKAYIEKVEGSDLFIINNQGGTSSSKTFSILQLILIILNDNPNWVCTVVSESLPALKAGAIRDFKNIKHEPYFSDMFLDSPKDFNKSESTGAFKNGSLIEFKSYEDGSGAKHGKRHLLYVNEINNVKEEVVEQLIRRTKFLTFFDYNADQEFYVHTKYVPRDDCKTLRSTFEHNRYCPEQTIKELYELKERNYNDWLVYGEGRTGTPSNTKPFFYDYDRVKHVWDGVIDVDPHEPLYLSIDFNYQPYTMLVAQKFDEEINILECHQGVGGTPALCRDYADVYKDHPAGLYITGDFSGSFANSGLGQLPSGEKHNEWVIIEDAFEVNSRRMINTSTANPKTKFSKTLCNEVFYRIPLFIQKARCQPLIHDLETARQRDDGRLLKDEKNHQQHAGDAFRYLMHMFYETVVDVKTHYYQYIEKK